MNEMPLIKSKAKKKIEMYLVMIYNI
jgi:hypothetical protein